MEEVFLQLGFSNKEARLYIFMLEAGPMTAQAIAKNNKETRTNTYMILDRLASEGLVLIDSNTPVKRFVAGDPAVLKNKLAEQQQELKQKNALLASTLPELSALFRLNQHKPGVLYLEGLKGFKALLEDNARATDSIDLIASEDIVNNHEAWAMLQKGIAKRWAKGIKTRALFNAPDDEWKSIKMLQNAGYETRRWGDNTIPGEIVVYGKKVALTVYRPTIIVTILTNDVIAETFKFVFEKLWKEATT
jgi:sugar-specific transcriptional regulator TrmB